MNYRSRIAGALVAATILVVTAGCGASGLALPGQPTSAPTSTSARELLSSGPLTDKGVPGPDQGCQPPATIEVLAVANYVTSRDDEGDRQGFDHGFFQLNDPICGTKTLFVEIDEQVETGFYKVGDCVRLKLRGLQVTSQDVVAFLDGQGIAHANGCALEPVTAIVTEALVYNDTVSELSLLLDGGVTAAGERVMTLNPDVFPVRQDEIRVGDQVSFYPFERDFSRDDWDRVQMWMEFDEHWTERLKVLNPGPSPAPSTAPSQEPSVVHGDDGPLCDDEDESC